MRQATKSSADILPFRVGEIVPQSFHSPPRGLILFHHEEKDHMMKIRLLFLTIAIVHSGTPSAQPTNQMGTEAITKEVSAESRVQQNLRSLFDSLSKNDMKKTDSLRNILEQETEREQKTFDTMEKDLRLARGRNVNKQRPLYKNGDYGGRAGVFKRETHGNNGTAGIAVNMSELEAGYVKHFGNDPTVRVSWRIAELWNYEKNATKLRKFCASAHALAGKGEINVDAVVLRPRVLRFVNRQYRAMHILVAAYGVVSNKTAVGILDRDYWYTREPNHWYLTKGQRSSCAYSLTLDDTETGQFILEQNICGIPDGEMRISIENEESQRCTSSS